MCSAALTAPCKARHVNDEERAMVEAVYQGWASREQPMNEVPATVVLDRVIGLGTNYVVFVSTLSVFSTGIGFFTEVRGRGGAANEGLPVTTLFDGLLGTAPPDQAMLLGVEFADGRRAVRTPRGVDVSPGNADDVRLMPSAGRGSTNSVSAWWYLSPLPPSGDLTIQCAWPALGIPETRTLVPDADLIAASRRVHKLWEPARFFSPHPPSAPEALPPTSWFSGEQ
jgi:hypothetical protein